MEIGIPKEIKNNDIEFLLIPESVKKLTKNNEVFVKMKSWDWFF